MYRCLVTTFYLIYACFLYIYISVRWIDWLCDDLNQNLFNFKFCYFNHERNTHIHIEAKNKSLNLNMLIIENMHVVIIFLLNC
jgi:hypothetical protein